jgi:hypothetical protein
MEIKEERLKDNVMKALADDYARRILLATLANAKSALDLSREHEIPISSVYRRIHDLVEGGLLAIERSIITEDGKRFELYRSTVKAIQIRFEAGSVSVDLTPSEDMVSKFFRMWNTLRGMPA